MTGLMDGFGKSRIVYTWETEELSPLLVTRGACEGQALKFENFVTPT